MARFDVYANPDREERKHTPYVLDLQNTFLEIDTFVAVPLRKPALLTVRFERMHPELRVAGEPVIMDTAMIATLPKRGFGQPLMNLRSQQLEIQDALDVLFGEY